MLANSRLAYKPLTKAELGRILLDFSTVKEAENPLAEPRFIKRSELVKIFKLTPNQISYAVRAA